MDRIIELKVFGNHMTKDSNKAGTRGEGNITNLRITFDESWDNYAKEAIFWDAYGQNPTINRLTENLLEDKAKSIRTYLVPIPAEAMARAGMLTFVIKGITVQESKAEATEPRSEEPLIGKIQVSVTGRLEVEDSPDMLSPVNPTADQWNQMQSQYNEILGDLQAVAQAMGKLPAFKENLEAKVKEQAGIAAEQAGIAAVKADEALESRNNAETARSKAAEEKERAKEYADSAATSAGSAEYYAYSATVSADAAADSAGSAIDTAKMVDLNVGILSQDISETKEELEAHKDSFDHPDKSITTEKLADGAVTDEKIDDEAVLPQHLSVEVVERIDSNKFDGYIATIADADGIDNRDNPHNVRIFRVGKDNGKGEGGILIVSGDTNTLQEHHPLEGVEQTYITHDGYINTRHATNWDGYDGLVFEWSEWKSRYLTSEDVQELKAKTGYFSSSLAAGNVDYEIIAYDMTGIFGGLPVEPLSVLVSPDNTGIWESLSIVYADINGVRCKLNRGDFATDDLTANQINGYTGDKKDWFVYWYIGSDYDFNSEELNTGKYDISMAVPKFKVDEYGNISASSLKLKYDDRAIQIVNTAEGESIAMPDSSDNGLKGLRIFGRTEQYTNGFQLFDVNNLIGGNANLDNASLAINEDGSFTITNNTSQNAHFSYTNYIGVKNIFKVGKNLRLKVYGATNVEVTLGFSDYGDVGIDGTFISNRAGGQDSFEMTQTILDNAASLTVLMDGTLDGSASETIKIMLYQDGDGTWEPFTGGIPAPTTEFPCKLVSVGDDGSVDVNVYGKNLTKLILKKYEYKGNTVTVVSESALVLNGTATGEHSISMSTDMVLYAGTYTMSVYGLNKYSTTYDRVFLVGKDSEGNTVIPVNYVVSGSAKTFTLAETTSISGVSVVIKEGSTYNNTTVNIQIERGNIATEYEPFKPIQTLTIPTPNGLPAVPVSSDGNYTDASGQQWVCDEKNYGGGGYIKRVYT